MKRVVLAALLLVLSASRASAQGVAARVGGELTAFTGATLRVPVEVDLTGAGGAKLGSYTARVQWDPAVLSLYNVRAGDFVTPIPVFDSIGQGVVRFSAASSAGASGILTIGAIDFTVAGTSASSPIDLSFSQMSAAGTLANLLPVNLTNGTFCTARGRWGDLDSDGFSNSRDALAVLSSLVGMTISQQFDTTLADVDGDSKVNSRDALIVLSYAVGLDIAGQRVLLPAPQAGCASGSPRQISVFPAAAELTVNQPFSLLVRGTDGSGHAVSVPQATWRSSDPTIASVGGDGFVVPQAPGTVTLTATVAPGLKGEATITVIARRPNWYVDQRATGAAVQLGTVGFPFESFNMLEDLPLEGDTARVASGIYQMDFGPRFDLGMVILGGTPGDTTTRPVFRSTNTNTGLRFDGGSRLVLRNVAFEGYSEAINITNLRSLAVEDARFDGTTPGRFYNYGIVVQCDAQVDSVRIERSEFASDSTGIGVLYDNSGCRPMGLTVVRNSKFTGWENGLQLFNVDSVAITTTEVSGNTATGIYIGQGSLRPEAFYLAHSRVERNQFGIEVDNARRVVIDTSVIRSVRNEALDISGACCTSSAQVYLHGDSIYHEASSNWISATGLDSLVFDHSIVRFPADTSTSVFSNLSAQNTVLRFSKFLNVGFVQNPSQPFVLTGTNLFVDSLEMTGCNVAACAAGDGIWMITEGPGNLFVQRSRFSKIGNPILSTGTGAGTIHSVTDVLIDSAFVGIQLNGDSNHVSRNTLTRVTSGIRAASNGPYSRGQSVISGNSISCSQGGIGINFVGGGKRYLVAADTVSSCDTGIFLNGLGSGTTILGNAIRGGQYGIEIAQDTSTVVIDSTGISGASLAGVFLSGGHLVMTRSRVENNAQYGVDVATSSFGVPQLHQNSLVGNVGFAIHAADTVDASSNWWGAATGPCTTGADCYSGRINVNTPLAAPPSALPGLVAPIFAAGAFRAGTVAPTPQVSSSAPVQVRQTDKARMAAVKARILERHRAFEAERRRRHAEIEARAARDRTRSVSKTPARKPVSR